MSPTDPRGPIVAGELWSQVMAAAGDQCQCADRMCGKVTHSASSDRKRDEQGRMKADRCQQANRRGSPLQAVTVDPLVPPTLAPAAPAEELMAMCDTCRKGRDRIAEQHLRMLAEQSLARAQVPLFDFDAPNPATEEHGPTL